MSLWTAGIVVLTLLVNAPLIPVLLKWTGLSQVSPVKAKIRAKAARAFTRYTQNAVKELKNDEDEMLRGMLLRGLWGSAAGPPECPVHNSSLCAFANMPYCCSSSGVISLLCWQPSFTMLNPCSHFCRVLAVMAACFCFDITLFLLRWQGLPVKQ